MLEEEKGPAPQGSRECRAIRRAGRRAGRPGPDRGKLATPGRLSAVLALVAGPVSHGEPAAARAWRRVGCGIESLVSGRLRGRGGRVAVAIRRGGFALRRRELHDTIEQLLLGRRIGDLGRADKTKLRAVLLREEAIADPAEDVVDDRLRESDLRIAGPAGGLEAHVRELLDEMRQRDPVLERERDAETEGVHHPREGRPLLRHRDEELARRAVVEEADGDVALVSFDRELVGERCARVCEATTRWACDLDDPLDDGLRRRGGLAVGLLVARVDRLDLLAAVAVDRD